MSKSVIRERLPPDAAHYASSLDIETIVMAFKIREQNAQFTTQARARDVNVATPEDLCARADTSVMPLHMKSDPYMVSSAHMSTGSCTVVRPLRCPAVSRVRVTDTKAPFDGVERCAEKRKSHSYVASYRCTSAATIVTMGRVVSGFPEHEAPAAAQRRSLLGYKNPMHHFLHMPLPLPLQIRYHYLRISYKIEWEDKMTEIVQPESPARKDTKWYDRDQYAEEKRQ
ncbi:hypothetical protein BJV74DRAFT_796691 [Russula compacta]|nr:hypothetical protein BJV74DRAFT_796691 [Russula compacta]